ncbi:MAG: ABC transporter substrate-binding protein, partial [Acidimicrobiia bacterium]|nr:ABC transporter substrate-binding protein [Acidimicrobiia bacterium]
MAIGMRTGVLATTIAVLAMGCSSSGDGSAGTGSTIAATPTSSAGATTSAATPESIGEVPATSLPLTASYRGVSEDAIAIAIPIVDEATIERDFSVELNWGDQQAKYELALARVNDAGGVLGRTLDATFIEYVPITQDNTDQVCLEATEDLGVFAVVGFIRPDAGVLCFTELNDTPFVGGGDVPTSETRDRSIVPALYPAVSAARLDEALVEVMDQRGALAGRTIAVHGRDTARLDTVEAALAARGYEASTRTVLDAPESDALEMASQLDVIVERWNADGIDLVLNTTTNISMLAAVNRAGLEVDIATNSTDVALGPDAVFAQGATEAEVSRVTLVSPASLQAAYESGHGPTVTCVDEWNSAHPDEEAVFDPSGDQLENIGQVLFACQNIELFALVAGAAGVDLTPDTMLAALDELSAVELPGVTT